LKNQRHLLSDLPVRKCLQTGEYHNEYFDGERRQPIKYGDSFKKGRKRASARFSFVY